MRDEGEEVGEDRLKTVVEVSAGALAVPWAGRYHTGDSGGSPGARHCWWAVLGWLRPRARNLQQVTVMAPHSD